MKKFIAPIVIGLAILLLPATQAGVGLGFVDLPQSVETGITAVVVFVVGWVFTKVVLLLPFLEYFKQYEMQVALTLSAYFISLIENAVPDAFGGVAISGIVFVLAILALFGIGEKLWGSAKG